MLRIQNGFTSGLVAASLALAHASSAAPIVYAIQPFESNISVDPSLTASANVEPDLLNTFPQSVNMVGSASVQPNFGTTLTADTGLPGNFNNGANGITVSQWQVSYFEAIQMFSFGSITVPLGLGTTQPVAFTANLTSLSIVLDAPIVSPLVQNGSEWLWAGTANVTISGIVTPTVIIPTVQSIEGPPTPFSQSVPIAVVGTFSGNQFGSQVTVGIPEDSVQNLSLNLPPIAITDLDPLELGLVTIDFSFSNFNFADLTTALVYSSSTPIPEPNSLALLGLGLAAFCAQRRHRKRS